MRILVWLFRACLFFALFAFALNNQQLVSVRWFFGIEWRTPLVIVVLAAFGAGCALGVLAMVPAWWKQRRVARRHEQAGSGVSPPDRSADASQDAAPLDGPPRVAL